MTLIFRWVLVKPNGSNTVSSFMLRIEIFYAMEIQLFPRLQFINDDNQ